MATLHLPSGWLVRLRPTEAVKNWRIGRSNDVEVTVCSHFISRIHCSIRYKERSGEFLLSNTAGINGTYIRNTKVTDRHVLQDGDLICLASPLEEAPLDAILKFCLERETTCHCARPQVKEEDEECVVVYENVQYQYNGQDCRPDHALIQMEPQVSSSSEVFSSTTDRGELLPPQSIASTGRVESSQNGRSSTDGINMITSRSAQQIELTPAQVPSGRVSAEGESSTNESLEIIQNGYTHQPLEISQIGPAEMGPSQNARILVEGGVITTDAQQSPAPIASNMAPFWENSEVALSTPMPCIQVVGPAGNQPNLVWGGLIFIPSTSAQQLPSASFALPQAVTAHALSMSSPVHTDLTSQNSIAVYSDNREDSRRCQLPADCGTPETSSAQPISQAAAITAHCEPADHPSSDSPQFDVLCVDSEDISRFDGKLQKDDADELVYMNGRVCPTDSRQRIIYISDDEDDVYIKKEPRAPGTRATVYDWNDSNERVLCKFEEQLRRDKKLPLRKRNQRDPNKNGKN